MVEAAHPVALVPAGEEVDEAVKEDEVTLKVARARTGGQDVVTIGDQDVEMIGDQGGTMTEGVAVGEGHSDGGVTMHLTSKMKRTSHNWEHHEVGLPTCA